MRRRFQLPPSTRGLLFLAMAAGCGGRSTLLPHDHEAPSGKKRSDAGVPVDQAQAADAGRAREDGGPSLPCPSGGFDHDGLLATPCKPWTNCAPGQYVGAEGTSLVDRKCIPCPAASFSTAENAPTCDPWRACDGWNQTEKTAGTSTSDRACKISDGIRTTATEHDDQGMGIAVDKQGDVVIVGHSEGALAGAALGGYDVFVRKFDARGEVVWTRQFGTDSSDYASAVAIDGDGGIFVVGSTLGSLEGNTNGMSDAFVRKYDRDGVVAWTRQFGTADWDFATTVAVDAQGSATVAGVTKDASLESWSFLRTYSPNGDLVRSYDLDLPGGTSPHGLAVNAEGDFYLAGSSTAEIEGPRAGGFDAILMKLDAGGHVAWTRQYGTADTDEALAVALDREGNPWVAGYQSSPGQPNQSSSGEGFLRKYDARGTLMFSYSIDDSWWGGATGIAVDSRGHGFLVGTRIARDPNGVDVSHTYVEELDGEGTLLGPLPLGEPNGASARGVAVSDSGRVYVLVNPCSPFAGHRVRGECDTFVVQVR